MAALSAIAITILTAINYIPIPPINFSALALHLSAHGFGISRTSAGAK